MSVRRNKVADMDIPGFTPAGPKRLPAVRPRYALAHTSARARAGGARQDRWMGRMPGSPAEQWWEYSRGCAADLRAGRMPPPVRVHGPVLGPGEVALLSAEIGYSRYCRTSAEYSELPLMVAGRPAVMFGALAVQGVINHRRKTAAQRRAAAQWRWHQSSAVIVTTERLMCSTAQHGLLSFWFADVAEFYPDLAQWTLTLGFGSTDPVRLSGPAAPALCLWSGYGVLGDGWAADPRLAALL